MLKSAPAGTGSPGQNQGKMLYASKAAVNSPTKTGAMMKSQAGDYNTAAGGGQKPSYAPATKPLGFDGDAGVMNMKELLRRDNIPEPQNKAKFSSSSSAYPSLP